MRYGSDASNALAFSCCHIDCLSSILLLHCIEDVIKIFSHIKRVFLCLPSIFKLFHFAKEAEMLNELLFLFFFFFFAVVFEIVVISLERNDISSSHTDSQNCAEEVTPLLLFGWR